MNALVRAVRYIVAHEIPGAVVECGVRRDGSMMAVARTLVALGQMDPWVGARQATDEYLARTRRRILLNGIDLNDIDTTGSIWVSCG